MASDIVEQLRERADLDEGRQGFYDPCLTEAAQEIETLREGFESLSKMYKQMTAERDRLKKWTSRLSLKVRKAKKAAAAQNNNARSAGQILEEERALADRAKAERDELISERDGLWLQISDQAEELDAARDRIVTLTKRCDVLARQEAGARLASREARAELAQAQAKLKIARAAGRRLGEYWRVQANGAEGISDLLITNWRSKIGKALGLDMPLLSEQIEAINSLKQEAAASRDGRARAEECLAKMMAECEAIVKDYYDVKEGSPEAAVEDAVQRIKAAGQLNRKGAGDGE